jgi:uncharacterized protein YbaP (TraB family)
MLKSLASAGFALLCSVQLAAASCGGANLLDSFSKKDRAALDAAVAAHPYPKGNFWKAEKPGSTVHVVGTMHMSDPRHAVLAEAARPVIEAADLLILESTGETEAEMERIMVEKPEYMLIQDGPTLIDLLEQPDWLTLKARLEDRQIPGFMAAQMQPWFVGMMLSVPSCAMADVLAGREGLDGTLEATAENAGVPLAALDTPDILFELFAQDPIETQIEHLKISLALDDDGEDLFATMTASYFAGDHRELWELSRIFVDKMLGEDGIALFDKWEVEVLEDRNILWAEKLSDMISDKDVVIGVGAAHLSGETGVLKTLEKLGYDLSPV